MAELIVCPQFPKTILKSPPNYARPTEREVPQTHRNTILTETRSERSTSSKPAQVCFEKGQTTIKVTYKSRLAYRLRMD